MNDKSVSDQRDLPKAALPKRWWAGFLDGVFWSGISAVFGIPSGGIGIVLGYTYGICQDAFFGGGTSAGRKLAGQVLVDAQGCEVSYLRGMARNAITCGLWTVSCLTLLIVDIALVLFHPKGQTIADAIMRTQVVDLAYAKRRGE